MAARPLPEPLIDAGRRVLDAADRLGLRPQGAAWIYDYELEDWRFYLVTALFDILGPYKLYKWLMHAKSKLDLSEGLTILDVHVDSPDANPFYALIRAGIGREGKVAKVDDIAIGATIIDAVIYRMRDKSPPAELKRLKRRIEEDVRQLEEVV